MRRASVVGVLVAAMVGMFDGGASAQELVKAKVPFAFVVRGATLPAGTYEISSDNGILFVRGTTTRAATVALSHPADGSDPAGEQPVLVFTPHENLYVLSQIWASGSDGLALAQAGPHHGTRNEARLSSAAVLVRATTGN